MFDGVDTRTVVEWFDLGGTLPLGDITPADEVIAPTRGVQGLRELAGAGRRRPGAHRARSMASAIDFVLEGLYAQKKISRSDERGYSAGSEPAPRRPPRREEPASTRKSGFRAGRRSTTTRGWRLGARGWRTRVSGRAGVESMKYRYTKFTGDLLDELDLEDLVAKLSDLLLSSGFGNPYGMDEDERTMQALHDAILDALFNGGVLPEETIERLLGDPADGDQGEARSKLEELIQQIIERMGEQGYISMPPDLEPSAQRRGGAAAAPGPTSRPSQFEVTDKTLDFLGYRALRDLLGSLGKSSFGRHDTREQATGVETTGAPKPYEFGDTLNLDAGEHAAERGAARSRASSTRRSPERPSGQPASPAPQRSTSRTRI